MHSSARRSLNPYFFRLPNAAEIAAQRAAFSFTVDDILNNLINAELNQAILQVMAQAVEQEAASETEANSQIEDSQIYFSDEETDNNGVQPAPAQGDIGISTETNQEELSESATTPSPSMRRCG